MTGSTVIDADGHICEPELVWTEYTRPEFRDRVLQVRTEGAQSYVAVEGRDRRGKGQGPGPANACIPGGLAPDAHVTWADILPGSWDPAERLKVMAEEGIDRALFFPSIHLLWGDVHDPEIAAETCRAYNDWMSDFCRTDPEHLYGMAIVPFQDPELALNEVKRLRGLGLKGFISRPERFGDLALYDDACEPIWQAAVEDDLAFAIHGSFGSRMRSFSTGRYEGNVFYDHMIAHPFGQMAVMMDLIAGGVLDRHPTLRVGFFESGLGWIPYWLDRLDEHFEVMGHHTPWLKRRPSEIFAGQCFVSMEADEAKGLAWMQDKGLVHTVLWGSDYPHFDSTYPGAYTEARETFEATGPSITEQIVHANPSRYMGLSE